MVFYWYNEELLGVVKFFLSCYVFLFCDCKFGGRMCFVYFSGKVWIICFYIIVYWEDFDYWIGYDWNVLENIVYIFCLFCVFFNILGWLIIFWY